MITVTNIEKSFGQKKVLRKISLNFEPGKTNLIIGKSGSGKTVMMKCLVGLLEVDKGSIFYHDRDFSAMNDKERKSIRKEMGMLFQGGALFDSMNVEENIGFPMKMYTTKSPLEIRKRVDFCLERVNLKGVNKLSPSELSGGMIKRVAIARAIVLQPSYLFCDEPNSGLDPQTGNLIDDLILEITHEYNITTIVNTHDMNSVVEIGDKVHYIYNGELWWSGDKNNILTATNTELQDFVFSTELTRRLKT
ncbi:MAG: ATP-binding cassette domain-containing protein [Bacteroidales bacterium]|nr:ATP-binding cassette domain-containing protein [Bacteroidales bacterium]